VGITNIFHSADANISTILWDAAKVDKQKVSFHGIKLGIFALHLTP